MRKIVPIILAVIIFLITAFFISQDIEKYFVLYYDKPAKTWNEALPLGNGRIGAMVFGEVSQEHVQLNEETVWAGGPHNNVNPRSAEYFKVVRELVFKKEYQRAQEIANKHIYSVQNGMPYQPVGDLYIECLNHKDINLVKNYKRELDIENAILKISYEYENNRFFREMFTSFDKNVLLIRIWSDKKNNLNLKLKYNSPQKSTVKYFKDRIILEGITSDWEGIRGQVQFQSIVKPRIKGGRIYADDNSLNIENSNEVILFVVINTNFNNYADLSGNPTERNLNILNNVEKISYQELKNKHIERYKYYFNRVFLNLGIDRDLINKPVEQRLIDFSANDDAHLVSLYFNYGRYLLISTSQPGTQPPNLQGIWNNKMSPPWDCKYTLNINAEMNYWPAEVTNLSDLHEPFFRMIKDLSITGKEAARQLYKARGWVVHHNTDIWRITGPVDLSFYGLWPMGGAWLTQHIWQHFIYNGDTSFLREYYKVMKEAALFYKDILVEHPEYGWLVVCPSNSPENNYLPGVSVSAGATMDGQLLFDLFSNVIEASHILNIDKDFADSLLILREKLPPMHIGKHSQLQEWLEDFDRPDDKHRHVSHLYGLYPSNQISSFRTPELFEAARNSLEYRGDASTGWSMGWKVCLWARLLDGNRAYKLLTDQLSIVYEDRGKGGTYPNLLDAHPPFQIDGNFGCTAGIAEMLMQSHDGFIFILPALPDKWPTGKVYGLKARGGFIVDIEWDELKIKRLIIHSKLGGNCRIRTYNELKPQDNNIILKHASGENPNEFYKTPILPKPIISPEAKLKGINLKKTYLYDFKTDKEKSYVFIGL